MKVKINYYGTSTTEIEVDINIQDIAEFVSLLQTYPQFNEIAEKFCFGYMTYNEGHYFEIGLNMVE